MKVWFNKQLTFHSFAIVLLQCLVFCLPIYQNILAPLIVLFAITSIMDVIFYKRQFLLSKARIGLIGFYLVLACGLLLTNNIKAGTFDLEVKLSLIIFPLLFSFVRVDRDEVKLIFKTLIVGIFVFFIKGCFLAFLKYLEEPSFYFFFYTRLTNGVHPSYMSMYIVTSMAAILYYFNQSLYLFKNKRITLLVLLALFLINVMVLSKIGVVTSLLLIIFNVVYWVKQNKKYKTGFAIILSILLFMIISYREIEFFRYRVDEFTSVFKSGSSTNSSGIRLHIWKHATSLVHEKPILGHGTGDVKDVLIDKYREHNLTSALEHRYNAHNQFFQILISNGLIGLSLFLLSAYFGAKSSRLFLSFIIITFFYMSVESVLENQAGTIFFGLFFSLLSQKSLSKVCVFQK